MNYTITHDEAMKIHNGLCYLKFAYERLIDTVSPSIVTQLQTAMNDIEKGYSSVREQESKAWKLKSEMYKRHKEVYKFMSEWSMYEVEDLYAKSGIIAKKMVYKDHWGEKPVEMGMPNWDLSYSELWRAADILIRQSGDEHHIFIEAFKVRDDVIYLHCGS